MSEYLSTVPSQILVPSKILWNQAKLSDNPFENIKSKSTRKLAQKIVANTLHDASISYNINELDEANHQRWLQFYTEAMQRKNHRVVYSDERYHNAIDAGKKVYELKVFANENYIGSGIIFVINGRWNLAYKATLDTSFSNEKNASAGVVVDALFLQAAHENQAEKVISGHSANLFNIDNTFGYLNFKTKFGYEAQHPLIEHEITPLTQLANQHLNAENNILGCFGSKNSSNELMLYIVAKNEETYLENKQHLIYIDHQVILVA